MPEIRPCASPLPVRGLRLIARQIPGGHASEYFTRLSPGDPVSMAGPFGAFILGESHPVVSAKLSLKFCHKFVEIRRLNPYA